jgi:outer membrane biosynthesis protein TonB
MTRGLLLGLTLLTSGPTARAQATGPGYAAPGMPTLVQRGLPVSSTAPLQPWLTASLPRFWHTADSAAGQQEAEPFWLALRQRVRYPPAALAQQLGGRVLVSVQLTPAGVPQRVVVRQQVFTRATASPAAEKALVQEALRVSQLLRFRPQAGAGDSLVFPVIFFCCN